MYVGVRVCMYVCMYVGATAVYVGSSVSACAHVSRSYNGAACARPHHLPVHGVGGDH